MGIGDNTKDRAGDDVARLAEVRVVEEVEELGSELHTDRLADLRVLADRKVRIAQARPDSAQQRSSRLGEQGAQRSKNQNRLPKRGKQPCSK